MQRKVRIVASIMVVLLLVVGVIGANLASSDPNVALEASLESEREAGAAAIRGEVPASFTASGLVVPVESASLAFEVSGQVADISVEEGQEVEAGQPLLQLDTRDQEIALKLAEVSMLEAEVDVAAAEAELAAARVELEAATTALAGAEANLALAIAGPTEEQVALQTALVAVARARVQEAVGNQAMVLEAVTPAEIRLAEAELAAAQADLIAVRAATDDVMRSESATEEERTQAQLQLDAVVAGVEAAEVWLDELQAGTTAADRQVASGEVEAASQQENAAQTELALLVAGSRPEAIAILEAYIARSRRTVEEAELGVEQAEMLVFEAEATVAEAETALRQALAALDKTIIVAPFTGTVAHISVKVGEGVRPQVPVLILADFSEWRIETTDLSELDIVNVAPNDMVEVTLDAFPSQEIRGRIVDIAITADAAVKNDVVYAVTVELDDNDLPLRWGMTAVMSWRGSSQQVVGESIKGTEAPPLEVADADPFRNPSPSHTTAETVVAIAAVEPLLYTKLSFEDNGQVAESLVETGDIVEAGDLLVRLDGTEVELALQQARQQLLKAEAARTVAQVQVQVAQAAISTAQEQVVVAQAELHLLQVGPRPEEVAAAEARLAAANSAITVAAGSRDSTLNEVTPSAIRAAETNLATASATRFTLETQYQIILTTCYDRPDGSQVCPLYGPIEERTRAQLEAARMNEEAAQATLSELQAGSTQAERQVVDSIVARAVANRDIAQAELDSLLAAPAPEEIIRAEVVIEEAEVNVRLAKVAVQEAEVAVAWAEAQVVRAQIAVDAAEATLAKLTLKAPFDGLVAQVDAHPGEVILGGDPILTLAGSEEWIAKTTDLSQLDIVHITLGSRAQVRLDAIGGETISGIVSKVSLTPTIAGRDVVYDVVIRLDDVAGLPLRWGMTGLVEIDGE